MAGQNWLLSGQIGWLKLRMQCAGMRGRQALAKKVTSGKDKLARLDARLLTLQYQKLMSKRPHGCDLKEMIRQDYQGLQQELTRLYQIRHQMMDRVRKYGCTPTAIEKFDLSTLQLRLKQSQIELARKRHQWLKLN